MGAWESIDSAWASPYVVGHPDQPAPKVYFFSGDEYARYDVVEDKLEYTLPIAGHWGALEGPVSGGFTWPDAGGNPDHAYYLLPNSQYSKFSLATGEIFTTYPRPIEGNWPGVNPSDWQSIDAGAGFLAINKGFLYGVSGGSTPPGGSPGGLVIPTGAWQQVSLADHSAQGSISIEGGAGEWPVPPGYGDFQVPDTVLAWPTNTPPAPWWPSNVAYFFTDVWYTKVDVTTMTAIEGPTLIADGWHGMPMAAPPPPPPPPGTIH